MTTEAILGRNLYALDALGERVSQVIYQLPLRGPDGQYLIPDEAVRTTALTAEAGARSFWKLSCAARAEIVRRIKERTADQAVVRREVAREAAEQGIAVRALRRDAAVGEAFAPLFAEQDSAPDLSKEYYTIALRSPDPPAALAMAQANKDTNPLYSASDFEADLARARMADPAASYGASSEGRCALAYVAPFWSEGVMEATERCLELPLPRWLLPDAFVLLRTLPRAIDLGCRILNAHNLSYQQCVVLPVPPFRDGSVWHTAELLLIATRGKLRLPDGLPGTWRDPKIERCIDMYLSFVAPKLAVHPRHGMHLGEGWVTVDDLPGHVR